MVTIQNNLQQLDTATYSIIIRQSSASLQSIKEQIQQANSQQQLYKAAYGNFKSSLSMSDLTTAHITGVRNTSKRQHIRRTLQPHFEQTATK